MVLWCSSEYFPLIEMLKDSSRKTRNDTYTVWRSDETYKGIDCIENLGVQILNMKLNYVENV